MAITSKDKKFDTPVLLVIFNRPATTKRVFEAIRKIKPPRLYIAADGPRPHVPTDREKCSEARKIVSEIDWECEVKTLFRDTNFNCGVAPSLAFTWFFKHEEEGIILEDDCVPSQSFFWFCQELLVRYRHDTRVMQIGGLNFIPSEKRDDEYSYFFSNYNYIWGWATWRRAWDLYSYHMPHYQEIVTKNYHEQYFHTLDERDYFNYVFDHTYRNNATITWWDHQWQYIKMLQAGLTIVPSRNLVINLGSGYDATHTVTFNEMIRNLALEEIGFPLKHPEFMLVDRELDSEIFKELFTTPLWRAKQRIKRMVPASFVDKGKQLIKMIH